MTFPLLEHPGQTFAVVLDRGDEMRGYSEANAKDDVVSELEIWDREEFSDYPQDIDLDEDHVTCHRLAVAEAEEVIKSSVNASWWR